MGISRRFKRLGKARRAMHSLASRNKSLKEQAATLEREAAHWARQAHKRRNMAFAAGLLAGAAIAALAILPF